MIAGLHAPAPRLTAAGVVAIAQWLGVPLIVSALALDVVAWLVITWMLDHCYGALCLFGAG
mgnify:CR=1 FL=1